MGGTGESWLFTFFPSFKVYSWTGENNYIVRGGSSNLVIGSSDGGFGIWLDESFNQGRSQAVSTFGNKPLPGREDFIVNNVECWRFHCIEMYVPNLHSCCPKQLSAKAVYLIFNFLLK